MKKENFIRAIEMFKYIFIIVALSFIVYANALNNEFVSDDLPAIVNNPNISNVFYTLAPLDVINSLNYRIGRFNPFVHHLTNIIIHSLNSLLVFFFLGLFFKRQASFLGSLIFAVHPVHTEAITWISGKGYALFTFFLLVSFLLYVRATSQPRLKINYFLTSLFLHLLAIYTSTFALFYPAMLVLYDFTFARWRKTWRLWIIFFAFSLINMLFMAQSIKDRVAIVSFDTGSTGMSNPVFNTAYSVFFHLGLLLWPGKLTLYHEPLVISTFALSWGIFFLLLLILFLPLIFKKARELFFAICIFILFLAPTYSPVMVSWLVAERYLYLPSVAFSVGVAYLVAKSANTRKAKIAVNVAVILLITGYSIRAVVRNSDWKTHASIWRATVKVSPNSPKARNNMGDVYCREGNLEKALGEFSRAVELKPDYADAYHNLANTYQQMNQTDKAIINYKKAVSVNPRLWQSYQNLGAIYFNNGERGLAKEYFQKAQELNPSNSQLQKILEGLTKLNYDLSSKSNFLCAN